MRIGAGVIIGMVALACACRQQPASLMAMQDRVCAPPAAVVPAGRIRIDGWWGPTVNDSLVVVVDGRERWRGLYLLCTDERSAAAQPFAWRPGTADSIRTMYVIRGDTVRRTFHVGGTRPSAMLIETAPR